MWGNSVVTRRHGVPKGIIVTFTSHGASVQVAPYVLYIPNMPEAQRPAASKKVKPKLITADDIEDPDNDA